MGNGHLGGPRAAGGDRPGRLAGGELSDDRRVLVNGSAVPQLAELAQGIRQ